MAGRIITLQRQARELGRLRLGWSEPYTDRNGREKRKPVKSTKWVLTTPQRAYLDAAVEAWGGQIEEWQPQGNGPKVWRVITEAVTIDAILPPGDPLSQSYEMWSRGGAQRRCDGETEQLSCKACPCRAEFGEEFYLEPPDKACKPYSRLNVVLPDMPDLGVWRVETKGYYAANEIAAAVDLILHATGGKVAVPIRLRIEPRTRVSEGKTKHYLVLALEIRGATAGQILAGQPATIQLAGGGQQAVEGGPQRPAIGAAPAEAAAPQAAPLNGPQPQQTANVAAPKLTKVQALKAIAASLNQKQLDMVADDCKAAGLNDDAVIKAWTARSTELAAVKPTSAPPAAGTGQAPAAGDPVEEAEVEPDTEALWMQILSAAGQKKWNSDALEERIYSRFKKPSDEISGWDMATFLDEVKSGAIA